MDLDVIWKGFISWVARRGGVAVAGCGSGDPGLIPGIPLWD